MIGKVGGEGGPEVWGDVGGELVDDVGDGGLAVWLSVWSQGLWSEAGDVKKLLRASIGMTVGDAL